MFLLILIILYSYFKFSIDNVQSTPSFHSKTVGVVFVVAPPISLKSLFLSILTIA